MDLSGLDTSPQSPPSFPEFPTPTDSLNAPSQEMGISLLDDELMSLGNSTFDSSHSLPSWHDDCSLVAGLVWRSHAVRE